MIYNPTSHYIVVELLEDKKQTKGGIFLPNVDKQRPRQGKVIKVGPGKDNIPMQAKIGDIAIFQLATSAVVEIENSELIVIAEPEVFGFIRE